ncbi:MAG TPA: hypothetical protein VFA26_19965 [Gemmataceae bacterium]|nr:hypothetical protein [Gemmataceae bacterium]
MERYRPGGITAIAILHLIGGSILLLSSVCGGAMQLAGGQQAFTPATTAQSKQQKELQERMEKVLNEKLPGYKAIQYGQMGLSFVISVMLLTAGIGLLKMQPWARTLSIVYAIISILNHVFSIVYGFAFSIPATRELLREEAQRNPQVAQFSSIMEAALPLGIVVSAIFVLYPIVVLIVMMLPGTKAAFAGEPYGKVPPDDIDEGVRFGDRPRPGGEPETGYRPE